MKLSTRQIRQRITSKLLYPWFSYVKWEQFNEVGTMYLS